MVIDTSPLIEYLRAKDKKQTAFYQISPEETLYVSTTTIFELYIGATSTDKIAVIEELIVNLKVLPLDKPTAIRAGRLYDHMRRIGKMVDFRDILIAATAIEHQMPLKTLNTKHFVHIPDLVLA